MTRKEIYKLFANKGLYLPKYQLDLVESDMRNRINKGESIFTIIYDYEKRNDFNHFTDKAKGQYVLEKSEIDRVKRSIIRIDDDGVEKKYESIYAAAKELGLSKDCVGNISKAASGKTKVAYKFKWKWDI